MKKAELALQEARDQLVSQEVVNAAQIRKAEIKVRQAELALQEATETLEKHTLTAPEPGLVVYMEIWRSGGRGKVQVGDTPWAGQEIIQLPDLARMLVRTRVNEVDINRIEVGQTAEVTVDALPDQTFRGRITHVATLAKRERRSEVKYFDVDIEIDERETDLRPGMSASCRIVVESFDDVVTVPVDAVFEDGEAIVVYARDGASRSVELGSRGRDRVVVRAGLEAGEAVRLDDPLGVERGESGS